MFLRYNIGYSEIEVVACTPDTFKCNGGWTQNAYNFIVGNGGIDSEAGWPYPSEFAPRTQPDCDAAHRSLELFATITGYVNVTPTESALQQAIAQQPVSIAIAVNCEDFFEYSGGVLDISCSDRASDINHAVIAVGYNLKPSNGDKPYYIVKCAACLCFCFSIRSGRGIVPFFEFVADTSSRNSWSTYWGEKGYVRMAVGINIDCIACEAIYPVAAAPLPPPPPYLQCPDATTDPKQPTSCPQGSACCCTHFTLFEKKCASDSTQCCLPSQTCEQGKGCH